MAQPILLMSQHFVFYMSRILYWKPTFNVYMEIINFYLCASAELYTCFWDICKKNISVRQLPSTFPTKSLTYTDFPFDS